ncbi:hypothetical protein QJS04_geneDACA013027 [Acorus gramineus]|uniref:Uncharacterized protein n=1 Tax=Acorus gramineus TaxID=55184 RepID=A0AAV9B5B5_ACOGR|nr:hypothetical protein QJS04_geneDACA013027 [Acorus gramineus]
MRVLFGKFNCPSLTSLFSPCSVKLENTQHVPSVPTPVPVDSGGSPDGKVEIETEKDGLSEKAVIVLKSSLKRPPHRAVGVVGKGGVKWMDFLGKELVEVREFESTESEESEDDYMGNRACVVCVIQ